MVLPYLAEKAVSVRTRIGNHAMHMQQRASRTRTSNLATRSISLVKCGRMFLTLSRSETPWRAS